MSILSKWLASASLLALGLFSSPALLAQTCDIYFPLKTGVEHEMENFNEKNKSTGKVLYRIKSATTSGGRTLAALTTEFYNAKGKKQGESEDELVCDQKGIHLSMRNYSNFGGTSNPDWDTKVEGDPMLLPATLKVGQTLPDARMNASSTDRKSGMNMSKSNIRIYNRKVEAQETITTPAGTFQCFRISQDVDVQSGAMGINMPAMTLHAVEWMAPGTGTVRSQFSRKDKLMGYSVLTRIKH